MARTKLSLNKVQDVTLNQLETIHHRHMKSFEYSQATLLNYEFNYRMLFLFFGDDKVLNSFTDNDVVDYMNWLRDERKISTTSINTRLRHLRSILNFANDRGYCSKVNVKLLTCVEKKKVPLTNDEIKKLIKHTQFETYTELRGWCISNLVLSTGIRSRNIREALISDLDLSKATLLLRNTKTHKEQIVYLPPTMIKILHEYLSLTGFNEGYLFRSELNESLTPDSLKMAFIRYSRSRGVRTSLHVLRHTFCKNCIVEQNLNPFIVQQLMGHSDIKTTQRYVNMFSEDVENAISGIDVLAQYNKPKKIKLK